MLPEQLAELKISSHIGRAATAILRTQQRANLFDVILKMRPKQNKNKKKDARRVYFKALALRMRAPPLDRGQGSLARSPIPIIRPAGWMRFSAHRP